MYTPEEKNAINFKNKDIDRMSQSERMSQSDSEECGDGWPKKKGCRRGASKLEVGMHKAGKVAKGVVKVGTALGAGALAAAEIVAAKNKKQSPTGKFINKIFNPQ
tara:strand:+ start:389 stop:703 length:315 start_codon:yes stop_codon:yes gene_type:complete